MHRIVSPGDAIAEVSTKVGRTPIGADIVSFTQSYNTTGSVPSGSDVVAAHCTWVSLNTSAGEISGVPTTGARFVGGSPVSPVSLVVSVSVVSAEGLPSVSTAGAVSSFNTQPTPLTATPSGVPGHTSALSHTPSRSESPVDRSPAQATARVKDSGEHAPSRASSNENPRIIPPPRPGPWVRGPEPEIGTPLSVWSTAAAVKALPVPGSSDSRSASVHGSPDAGSPWARTRDGAANRVLAARRRRCTAARRPGPSGDRRSPRLANLPGDHRLGAAQGSIIPTFRAPRGRSS